MNAKKILFAALTTLLVSNSAKADQTVCIFDLLGRVGESYKLMEEWALASKNWGADVKLVA